HLGGLAVVLTVVPEPHAAQVAPILLDGECAAKGIGSGTVFLGCLEYVFVAALTGKRQRIAGCDLWVREDCLAVMRPQVGSCLEIVQQGWVVRFVVGDGYARDGRQAQLGSAGG